VQQFVVGLCGEFGLRATDATTSLVVGYNLSSSPQQCLAGNHAGREFVGALHGTAI